MAVELRSGNLFVPCPNRAEWQEKVSPTSVGGYDLHSPSLVHCSLPTQ